MMTTDDDITRYMQEADERRRNEAQEANRVRVEVLLPILRAAGVTEVHAEYDGQGDSGQIEDATFFYLPETVAVGGELTAVTTPELTAIREQVNNLFYVLLEDKYAGWEINEGSYGQFEWDVATDKIQLTHNMRIESIETYEEEL